MLGLMMLLSWVTALWGMITSKSKACKVIFYLTNLYLAVSFIKDRVEDWLERLIKA